MPAVHSVPEEDVLIFSLVFYACLFGHFTVMSGNDKISMPGFGLLFVCFQLWWLFTVESEVFMRGVMLPVLQENLTVESHINVWCQYIV